MTKTFHNLKMLLVAAFCSCLLSSNAQAQAVIDPAETQKPSVLQAGDFNHEPVVAPAAKVATPIQGLPPAQPGVSPLKMYEKTAADAKAEAEKKLVEEKVATEVNKVAKEETKIAKEEGKVNKADPKVAKEETKKAEAGKADLTKEEKTKTAAATDKKGEAKDPAQAALDADVSELTGLEDQEASQAEEAAVEEDYAYTESEKLDLNLISPTREKFLGRYFPVWYEHFQPMSSDYPLPSEIWDATAGRVDFEPNTLVKNKYETILKKLQNFTGTTNKEKEAALFLKADLIYALADKNNKDDLAKAKSAYERNFQIYPVGSTYQLPAAYNLALIYLDLETYINAVALSEKMEIKSSKLRSWASLFRSVTLESYYRRGRYIRIEDFLWELAGRINLDELSPYIARRYGDALFWQQKYDELVAWYSNPEVRKCIEEDYGAAKVSKLYYTEALFQSKKIMETETLWSDLKPYFEKREIMNIITYRMAQIDLLKSKKIMDSIRKFYGLNEDLKSIIMRNVSQIQWARLVAHIKDAKMINQAHLNFQLKNVMGTPQPVAMKKEADLVKAQLEMKLGDRAAAFKTLQRIIPSRYIPGKESDFDVFVSNLVVDFLKAEAPMYWKKKDIGGFLVVADKLKSAIQMATNKTDILFWIARAYMEGGMSSSATRLYERILFELKPTESGRIGLELARAYGMMGETELMGKALKLVTEVPADSQERLLYYLTHATYDLYQGHYNECINQFESLLQKGVQGNELFQFSLQGAICARKAKDFDKAQKFMSFLGLQDDKLISPTLPEDMQQIQLSGVFEKINLLGATGDFSGVVNLFEKIQTQQKDLQLPLDTLFFVLEAYRKQAKPDLAIAIWKDYSVKIKGLPKNFNSEYDKLLDIMGRVELVPMDDPSGSPL